jgi:hydrogenase maturation protease
VPRPPHRPLVIGVGNPDRGDDRCGLEVARTVRRDVGDSARVVECTGNELALLDLWEDGGLVVVVDGVRSGRPAGTVHRWEVGRDRLPTSASSTSTHGLSLGEAFALGASVGHLPERLVLYGIEVERFGVGDAMTPKVQDGVSEAVRRVRDELRSAGVA